MKKHLLIIIFLLLVGGVFALPDQICYPLNGGTYCVNGTTFGSLNTITPAANCPTGYVVQNTTLSGVDCVLINNFINTSSDAGWMNDTIQTYTNLKVGIGTNSPTHTLNVIGSTNITGNLIVGNNFNYDGLYNTLTVNGSINGTQIYDNGSRVCTAVNGLCPTGGGVGNSAGWINQTNLSYTTNNVGVGSNNLADNPYLPGHHVVIDDNNNLGAGIVLASNGQPVWDMSTYIDENGTILYLGYNYRTDNTAFTVSQDGRVGLNKQDNILEYHTGFIGTGLNDGEVSGVFTGEFDTAYEVKAVTDSTFEYRSNINNRGFSDWSSPITMLGMPQLLEKGVYINFPSPTGHTINDLWFFTAFSQRPSGTFTINPPAFIEVQDFNGTDFFDDTFDAQTSEGIAFDGLSNTNTAIYVARVIPFDNAFFDLLQPGNNISLHAQYYNGSNWLELTIFDDTNNLSNSGKVTWDAQNLNWSTNITIADYPSNSGYYWIKFYTGTNATSTPTFNAISPQGIDRLRIYKSALDTTPVFSVLADGSMVGNNIYAGQAATPTEKTQILDEQLIVHKTNTNGAVLALGDINDYYQGFRVKNVNNGTASSSLWVVENNRPTADNFFMEGYCNGDQYSAGSSQYDQPDTCGVNSENSNLLISTGNVNKKIVFSIGHSGVADEVAEISPSGMYVLNSQVCTQANGLCGSTGTVTQVNTGIYTTGGPITTTGTIDVNITALNVVFYNKTETYNKIEIDNLTTMGGNRIYFLTNITDPSGNRIMSLTLPNSTLVEISVPISTNTISLGTFITNKTTGNTIYESGTRNIKVTARMSGVTQTITLQTDVFRCNNYNETDGTCGSMLSYVNSTNSGPLTNTNAELSMSYYLPTLSVLNTTSRYILNITATKTSGTNTNVILSVDDNTYSRIEVPSPVGVTDTSTLAHIGTCPIGQVVQNTTTGGVQCINSTSSSYINGTGILLTGTQFNISDIYLQNYNETAIINTIQNLSMTQITTANGNWSADKGNYDTIIARQSIGNWSADKGNYSNSTIVTNLIAANGNWSADKSSYNTTIQNNILFFNKTYALSDGNISSATTWNAKAGTSTANCAVGTVAQNVTTTTGGVTTQCIALPVDTNSGGISNVTQLITGNNYLIIVSNSTTFNITANITALNIYNDTTLANSKAAPANCAVGNIVQNTTTSGVQCVAQTVDTNSGGVSNLTKIVSINNGIIVAYNSTDANLTLNITYIIANAQVLNDSAINTTANVQVLGFNTTAQLYSSFYNISNPKNYQNDTQVNNSINTALATTTYLPNISSIIVGTPSGGNTVNNLSYRDSAVFNTTNNMDVRVNFTNVTSFNNIRLYQLFSDVGATNMIDVQLWDYTTSSWQSGYFTIMGGTTFTQLDIPVDDATDHISGGTVQLRFFGGGNGDKLSLDVVNLLQGLVVPSSSPDVRVSSMNTINSGTDIQGVQVNLTSGATYNTSIDYTFKLNRSEQIFNETNLIATINNLSNSSIASLMGNTTIARTANCPTGQFVQNTTNGGVQCMAPAGGGTVTQISTDGTTTGGPITGSGTVGVNTTWANQQFYNKSYQLPDSNISSASTWNGKSTAANCPTGQFVQNTTTGGVQCMAPAGGGTVTQVSTDNTLTGGPITGSGTIGFNITYGNQQFYNKSYQLPDSNISSATTWNAKAGTSTANCAVGTVAQNVTTTTGGVTTQCIALPVDTNSGGVSNLTKILSINNGIIVSYNSTDANLTLNITYLQLSYFNMTYTLSDGNISSASTWNGKATAANCPTGQIVQNTTTGGVQCVTQTVDTNSGGVSNVTRFNSPNNSIVLVYNSTDVNLTINNTFVLNLVNVYNDTIAIQSVNNTMNTLGNASKYVTNCNYGNYVQNITSSGLQCAPDQTGTAGGNPFDQWVNTTSNVTVNNLNSSSGIMYYNSWIINATTTTIQFYYNGVRVAILNSTGDMRLKGEIITNDATV